MPRRDGTGPTGFGPGTGRLKGGCFFSKDKNGMKRAVWGVVIPFAGAMIKDITNPHGIIRSLLGKLFFQRTRTHPINKIDASYTILDNKDAGSRQPDKDSAA